MTYQIRPFNLEYIIETPDGWTAGLRRTRKEAEDLVRKCEAGEWCPWCDAPVAGDHCCSACGVSFANPCPECNTHGYHLHSCGSGMASAGALRAFVLKIPDALERTEFENQVLSIDSEYLPEIAVAVRDHGAEPTAEYWRFLASQVRS